MFGILNPSRSLLNPLLAPIKPLLATIKPLLATISLGNLNIHGAMTMKLHNDLAGECIYRRAVGAAEEGSSAGACDWSAELASNFHPAMIIVNWNNWIIGNHKLD